MEKVAQIYLPLCASLLASQPMVDYINRDQYWSQWTLRMRDEFWELSAIFCWHFARWKCWWTWRSQTQWCRLLPPGNQSSKDQQKRFSVFSSSFAIIFDYYLWFWGNFTSPNLNSGHSLFFWLYRFTISRLILAWYKRFNRRSWDGHQSTIVSK